MDSPKETVTFIKRLRPYSIPGHKHNEDLFVRGLYQQFVDPETMASLDQYTRGMYTEALHYESFEFYRRPTVIDDLHGYNLARSKSVQAAIQRVRNDLFDCRGIQPISRYNMDSIKWIPSSAAGLGYVGKKADNYELARSNAMWALKAFVKYGSKYEFAPDKAFARSQLALRANPKIRHVWGRAFHNILIESLLGQPLIERLMVNQAPIFIGKDLHKDMPYAVQYIVDEGGVVYCLDFSKFDAYVPAYLIDIAWIILRELFDLSDPLNEIAFNYAETLFKCTPIVMPDGKLYYVRAGVPSGSLFTQIVDSIVNLILVYALQIEKLGHVEPTYVMGDDSIFSSSQPTIAIAEAAQFYRQFGMVLNEEKSIITDRYDQILFLGHNFYGSKVTRDEFTCLSLALFTEDEVTSAAQSAVRVASLLYDSGFNSFSLHNLYRLLLSKYQISWDSEIQRPIDTLLPFVKIFVLS
jgi:hypothetical protein